MRNTARIWLTIVALAGSVNFARATEWHWNVSEDPPVMSNATIVDVSKLGSINTAGWKRFFGIQRAENSILCKGQIYRIDLKDDEDAIVYMSGGQVLKYPLHITGGNNVRVVGLQFELTTQPGCGIGELPNNPVAEHPNANIHPRVPGAIALRLQQWGTTFVEGLNIDVRGHEADCIVIRNPDQLSNMQAQKQRDVVIQNTYCSGVEGMGKSDIGDGVHGDLFQNQGHDVMRRLVFENVTMRTSQEGIVLHGGGANQSFSATESLIVRRYDYSWDQRYVGDDDDERFGLAIAGHPGPNWTLENVRIDDYRDNGDYIILNGQRYGNSPNSSVRSHPEIHSGLPEEGPFAPPQKTGLDYVSPHGSIK